MRRDFEAIREKILTMQEATVRELGVADQYDSFAALQNVALALHDRLSQVENELCRFMEAQTEPTPKEEP